MSFYASAKSLELSSVVGRYVCLQNKQWLDFLPVVGFSYLCVEPHGRSIFLTAGLSFIWPELGTAQSQLVFGMLRVAHIPKFSSPMSVIYNFSVGLVGWVVGSFGNKTNSASQLSWGLAWLSLAIQDKSQIHLLSYNASLVTGQ